jgi:hypothetical protein
MKWNRTEKGLKYGPFEIQKNTWADSRRGKGGVSYLVLKDGVKIGVTPTLRYAKIIVEDHVKDMLAL